MSNRDRLHRMNSREFSESVNIAGRGVVGSFSGKPGGHRMDVAAAAAEGGDSSALGSSVYASTILSMEMDEEEERRARSSLNDQQWVLQRKKIGLSRRTKRSMRKVMGSEVHRNAVLDFIRNNFSRKECCQFVEDRSRRFKLRPMAASPGPSDAPVCHCGKPDDEHHSRADIRRADRSVAERPRFETIGEEDEGDGASVSTADTDIPVIRVGPGSGGRNSIEEWIDRKLAQPFRSISVSSGIDEGGGGGPMTSVDTDNSLRMDIEAGDRRGRGDHRQQRQQPKQQQRQQQRQQEPQPITLTTEPTNSEWVEKRSILEFPTNAFGQIEFMNEDEGSLKPSKWELVWRTKKNIFNSIFYQVYPFV